ncbi:MAG: hypothetical protein QM820_49005 [Minicystis sp.]
MARKNDDTSNRGSRKNGVKKVSSRKPAEDVAIEPVAAAAPPAARGPVIRRPPIKFEETQAVFRRLATKLDAPVVSYWNNPRGAVCHNDVIAIYKMAEKIGKRDDVYIFLKSDGGNGQASLRFVNVLREYFKNIHALVPLECCSAATMIALGANSIHMGPMSYLTAVDTALTHDLSPIDRDNDRVSVSLDELKRVIRLWQHEKDATASNPYAKLFEYVHPLVIGAVDRADSLSTMLCREILAYHVNDASKVNEIADTLNTRYPSHSYPILKREARQMGLNVLDIDHEVLDLLLELHHVYSEMGQKCTTDQDEAHSHTDEIVNIIESESLLLFYEMDKDWFYRADERRWIAMNDSSGWRRLQQIDGKVVRSEFHVV